MASNLETALSDARRRFIDARPKTKTMHEQASAFMPGGNTRTVLYHAPFPLRVEQGEGLIIYDLDGHAYLNILGEYTAGLFGHSHPDIVAALLETSRSGLSLSAHHTGETRLSALVCERFPDIQKLRFTNSGTEANLMAIATARYVTKRSKVMVFEGGYHGGVLYFAGGGLPINVPYPYEVGIYNDVENTRSRIRRNADTLACVVVEPMLGSGGCIPGSTAFLEMLREETEACGALLICDEVMTSRFWRHGASAHFGLRPDLIALGKWIGGGMSLGAFGGRDDILAHYDPSAPDSLPHAGTFNNNVVSMACGAAAFETAFTSDHAEALHERGNGLRERLNALFDQHDVSLTASGEGSLMNIHAVRRPVSTMADIRDTNEQIKELVFLDLLERGVYMARRGFIALPTIITDKDIDQIVSVFDDVVATRKDVFQAHDGEARHTRAHTR